MGDWAGSARPIPHYLPNYINSIYKYLPKNLS